MTPTIPTHYQKNTNNSIVSTESQKTVDNPIQNQAEIVKTTKKETNSQTKNTTKKSTKVNTDNVVPITENEKVDSQAEQSQTTNEQNKQKTETYKEHCFLYDTEYKTFKKAGKDTEYLIAKVTDINDKTTDVIVKPEFRAEMEKCDIGTELIIELEKFKDNIISKHIEFVNIMPKKVAA